MRYDFASRSAIEQNEIILGPKARKFYYDNGALFAEVFEDKSVKLYHPVTDSYTFEQFIQHVSLMNDVRSHLIYMMYPGPVCTKCSLPANEQYAMTVPVGQPDPGYWRCPSGHIFHPTEIK